MCIGANVEGVGCHPGIPREQMEVGPLLEREYLAELDALGSQHIPDEPSSLCWGCRRLYAFGPGPQAQQLRAAMWARGLICRAIRHTVPAHLAALADPACAGSPAQEYQRMGRLVLAAELLEDVGDVELATWLAGMRLRLPEDEAPWRAAISWMPAAGAHGRPTGNQLAAPQAPAAAGDHLAAT